MAAHRRQPRRKELPSSRQRLLKRIARPGAAFSVAEKAANGRFASFTIDSLIGTGAAVPNRFSGFRGGTNFQDPSRPSGVLAGLAGFAGNAVRNVIGQTPVSLSGRDFGLRGALAPSPTGSANRSLGGETPPIDHPVFPGNLPTDTETTYDLDSYQKDIDAFLAERAHLEALRREAFEQGLDDIASAFAGDITELDRRIAAAAEGQSAVNTAYNNYRNLIDNYADVARTAQGNPEAFAKVIDNLQDDALATVDTAFASAEEAVGDTLRLIGADDPDLAAQLAGEVREFDDFAKDAIGDGLDNIEDVMRAGIELSGKLIDSMEADDVLTSELARQATQARLGAYLEELKRSKQRLEDEKARALDKAERDFQDSFGEEITPQTLFDWSFDNWATENGMNFEERADARSEFDFWYKSGIRTREQIKNAILFGSDDIKGIYDINLARMANDPRNLAAMTAIRAVGTNEIDMAVVDLFIRQNPGAFKTISEGTGRFDASLRYTDASGEEATLTIRLPDGMERLSDPDNQSLLHMYDMWRMSVDRADESIRQIQDTLSINPQSGWVFPVAMNTGYSNSFGYVGGRSSPHKGIDIYAPTDTMIVSPVAGVVSRVGSNGNPGFRVYVKAPNGIEYVFFHMNRATALRVGDRVSAGALLGYVGTSGNAKGKAPHLHFEMRSSGKYVNPFEHLNASSGGTSGGNPSFAAASTTSRATSSGAPSSGRKTRARRHRRAIA